MKLAGQADFYVRQYGADAGLRKLKELGYHYVTYDLYEAFMEPSFPDWTRLELEEHFLPLRTALEKYELELSYVSMSRLVYSDRVPDTFKTQKKLCVQAVRAAACTGCGTVVTRLMIAATKWQNCYEHTKRLSRELLRAMAEEAGLADIRLAFMNNSRIHDYGSNGEELVELAHDFQAGIVLNPTYAERAGVRIEELVELTGDYLVGVLLTDEEAATANPFLPMMGIVDYARVREALQKCPEEAYLTVMYSLALKRYCDVWHHEPFVDAVGEYLFKMARVLTRKEGRE